VNTLKEWQKINNPDTNWIIRHALRTLLKQGHAGALELLGYSSKPEIKIVNLNLDNHEIRIGQNLAFSFIIKSESTSTQNIMIDYIVHFMKSNGKTSPKVFKLTQKILESGQEVTINKTHSFKPINTRPYYPGLHKLELQINGQKLGALEFMLHENLPG